MRAKSEIFRKFIIFKVIVENQIGQKIQKVRLDKRWKYFLGEFEEINKTYETTCKLTHART